MLLWDVEDISTKPRLRYGSSLVSKGDAEHRSVEFHQRDKMADISLGYETSVQLVSENLNFLSSFIDEHAEPQTPAPLEERNRGNKVFHGRRVQQPARKSCKCLTEKTKRSRCVLTAACWCLYSAFTARLRGKSHKI